MGLEAAHVGTIPYGSIAYSGDTVCSSEFVGLTCWNTKSKHGMFLAKEAIRTW